MKWKRVNQGEIKEPILEYLEKLFDGEMEKGHELKVCIGSDSQKAGKGYNFATAIVIEVKENIGKDEYGKDMLVGRGAMVLGTKFWEEIKASTNEKKHREIEVLNFRMLKEVQSSINVAYEVWPLLDLYGIPLEIHADINQDPTYGSNVALNEAMGYITGMGWESKAKPDAYAASTAADKMV
jgi:predicted RNase H-related nuclease YkuK (DUF458 family)